MRRRARADNSPSFTNAVKTMEPLASGGLSSIGFRLKADTSFLIKMGPLLPNVLNHHLHPVGDGDAGMVIEHSGT